MKSFLVVSSLLALAAAAPSRITNGEDAAIGQFPYQIALLHSENKNVGFGQICGGTIISPTWVVTAGHCIIDGYFKVQAGIILLSGDVNEAQSQIRDVIKTIVHPNYPAGQTAPNDIALVQVKNPFIFDNLVQKLNLPVAGNIPTGQAVISGWGSISKTIIPIYPNELQYATLPLITIDECAADLEAVKKGYSDALSADSNLCTGTAGNSLSACRGDSGGPLAQADTLIGIVSWGVQPCGNFNSPSVFTRVSGFIDFIKQYVNDL